MSKLTAASFLARAAESILAYGNDYEPYELEEGMVFVAPKYVWVEHGRPEAAYFKIYKIQGDKLVFTMADKSGNTHGLGRNLTITKTAFCDRINRLNAKELEYA